MCCYNYICLNNCVVTGKITHWEWRHTRHHWSSARKRLWPAINVEDSGEGIDVRSTSRTHAAIDFRSSEGNPRRNRHWERGRRELRRVAGKKLRSRFFHEHGFYGFFRHRELHLNWWIHCTAYRTIEQCIMYVMAHFILVFKFQQLILTVKAMFGLLIEKSFLAG